MSAVSSLFFLLELYILITSYNILALRSFDPKRAISVINGYRKLHLGEGHSVKQDAKLQTKAENSVEQAALDEGFPADVSAGQNVFQVCATFGAIISAKQVVKAW